MKFSNKPEQNNKLYDYALFQLAISPKSEASLIQKLKIKRRQLNSTSSINSIIAKLKKLGFLDDRLFIDYFIRRHSLWSNRRLAYELKRQKINFTPEFDQDLIKIKKIILKKKFTNSKRAFFYFARNGFLLSDVKIAFDELAKKV